MRSLLFVLILLPATAFSSVPGVYIQMGAAHNVPPSLLYAIAKTEAARPGKDHPWPWTANIEGKAHYYERRLDLYKALEALVAADNFNFDVGIMQISWKWNADLFNGDLWAATDPVINLEAGAKFLAKLRVKSGSFNTACGLYHVGSMNTSNRKSRALAYCRKVQANIPKTVVDTAIPKPVIAKNE